MSSTPTVRSAIEDRAFTLERAMVYSFLENIPDSVFFKDRESRFVATSASLIRHFGRTSADEVIGKTEFDFLAEDHAQRAFDDEQQILRTGEPLLSRLERESWPDGRVNWVLTTKLPWRNPKGEIIGVFGISKDVSEMVHAQGKVRESQAFYLSLVEALPQNILRKDREGRFTFANNLVCRDLKQPLEQIVGKNDYDFFPRELAEKYQADDLRVMAECKPFETIENHITPDGSRHYMHVIKVPLFGADGTPNGIQCMFWDVTAQFRTEEQLAEAHKQLLAATRQAGMAEVAIGILHNVGNVLNSVNVSAIVVASGLRELKLDSLAKLSALFREHASDLAAFLTQDPKGRLVPEYLDSLARHGEESRARLIGELDSLQQNIDHIKGIVSMQLSYATMTDVVESLDPIALMEDAVRMNGAALVRHGVSLVREFATVPLVIAERGKVLQILICLIRNAKRACDEAGRPDRIITLRIAQASPECVRLVVADNGIGIAAELIARIFTHGFTTRVGGHGFGLHSSALAAKGMKGSLTVQSDGSGKGATFTLELPVAPAGSAA